MKLVSQGGSYRVMGRQLGISKNTVADIVKRSRQETDHAGTEACKAALRRSPAAK